MLALPRRFLTDFNRERLIADVRRFQEEHGALPLDRQARRLVSRAARRCAVVGALASVPAGRLARAAAAPELSFLIARQCRLVFSLSILYGREPSASERLVEAGVCVAAGLATQLARETLVEGLKRGLTSRYASRALRRVAADGLERAAKRVLPLAGLLAGGAVCYWAVRTVGSVAIRYYSES